MQSHVEDSGPAGAVGRSGAGGAGGGLGGGFTAGRLTLAVLAAVGLWLGGCGETSSTGAADGRPVIVATTTMIADLARVLAGEDAVVVDIMKTGEDPHIYDVRPRDAQAIASADLVLTNGLHLEATLLGVIENNASGRVVHLAEEGGIEPLRVAVTGGGLTAGAPDPHAWMSVPNFMDYTRAARDAMIELDPAHEPGYRQRADAYLRQLDELDAWIRAQLGSVPARRRVIVTSHDAFNYYGQAYGVEVHGVIGISTSQQPSPQDIQNLERIVRERGVKALFIETSVSNTLNQIVGKIAQATGTEIGGKLYSDSLGEPTSDAGTYLGMMRANTATIVEALR